MTIQVYAPICSQNVNNCSSKEFTAWSPDGARGKEGGHEQMLGQAAAVLVSLSTLVALEVTTIGLLAILHEMLTFAGSSHTRLLKASLLFVIHIIIIILFIINCTLSTIQFPIRSHPHSVARQAGRW